MSTKLALLILDWFGINDISLAENAIAQAKNKPTFDKLFDHPDYTRLEASGRAVGIIDWFMWWSEVGHLTIGAGRIIKQSILDINDLIDLGEFEKLEEFKEMIDYLQKNKKTLHITGMLGFEWVHSYQPHLHGLIKIIPENINISLHLISDGRDSPIMDSHKYLSQISELIKKYPNVKISSLSGRYFAMDRDNNWERIEKTYDAILGKNTTNLSPLELLKTNYNKKNTDEFIEPSSFRWGDFLVEWDVFLHYNYRSDRATQLTQMVEKKIGGKYIYTMTKYYSDFSWKYFLDKKIIENTLSDILSEKWLKQLHLAETEKFAHVTKFFNWLRTIEKPGEDYLLVPSHKIEWLYDKDPEMSAYEILEEFEKRSWDYDFFVVNLANGDLVGHSGSLEASIIAVETLDKVVSKFIDICKQKNINLLITADHGNCEYMWTIENPCNSHTTNPVPFWYIKNWEIIRTKTRWWLADIAPTVLEIMEVDIPKEMTGESLIINKLV